MRIVIDYLQDCGDLSRNHVHMYYFNQFNALSTAQQYAVQEDFLNTPFQMNSSSGELAVSQSLQTEGTLSIYDIVIEANDGVNEAWTLTTIYIGEIETVLYI